MHHTCSVPAPPYGKLPGNLSGLWLVLPEVLDAVTGLVGRRTPLAAAARP